MKRSHRLPTPDEIAQALTANHIPFPATAPEKLALYLSELNRWNRRINLTRIPPEQQLFRIILESATLQPLVKPPLLDMGSGAGLPGVVLAALLPEQPVHLVDTRQKKTDFLEHVRFIADLPHMEVIRDRLENLPDHRPDLREFYRTITARALSDLRTCLKWGEPFLAPDGLMLLPGAGTSGGKRVLSIYEANQKWIVEQKIISMSAGAYYSVAAVSRRRV